MKGKRQCLCPWCFPCAPGHLAPWPCYHLSEKSGDMSGSPEELGRPGRLVERRTRARGKPAGELAGQSLGEKHRDSLKSLCPCCLAKCRTLSLSHASSCPDV